MNWIRDKCIGNYISYKLYYVVLYYIFIGVMYSYPVIIAKWSICNLPIWYYIALNYIILSYIIFLMIYNNNTWVRIDIKPKYIMHVCNAYIPFAQDKILL